MTNLGCFAIILLSDEGGQNDDPDNITTSGRAVQAPERGRKTAGGVGEQLGSDAFVESGGVRGGVRDGGTTKVSFNTY